MRRGFYDKTLRLYHITAGQEIMSACLCDDGTQGLAGRSGLPSPVVDEKLTSAFQLLGSQVVQLRYRDALFTASTPHSRSSSPFVEENSPAFQLLGSRVA